MEYIVKRVDKEYSDEDAVETVYDYITRFNKTIGMVDGYNVLPSYAVEMMKTIHRLYGVSEGNTLIHIVVSLHPKYGISPETLMEYARYIVQTLNDYQIVYGVHNDTDNAHIHFMINPVSIRNGEILTRYKAEWSINMICKKIFS